MTDNQTAKFVRDHLEEIMDMVQADNMEGYCVACGTDAGPVEPDARNYTCESCGEAAVFGAAELLLYF